MHNRNSAETPCPTPFAARHLGSSNQIIAEMACAIGFESLDALIDAALPPDIRLPAPPALPAPVNEARALDELRGLAGQNRVLRSHIGQGYYDCITPPVLLRNILENPGWFTAYTPYQAEISQGRLEALLNFQTMISDLTGMDIANASLLDEATAAAEAMTMAHAVRENPAAHTLLASRHCHPQTLAVVQTRARFLGIKVQLCDDAELAARLDHPDAPVFAILLQYPRTDGAVVDYTALIAQARAAGALAIVAADPLALTLLKSPGEMDADVAVGSTQRFGLPMGFGGPHAAYFATRDIYKRHMPGRLVGVSKDAAGNPALRLALQTREQHIRREKATSNICTAQVLPAIMASMYAVWHGPDGLRRIARRVNHLAVTLASSLRAAGCDVPPLPLFDTVRVGLGQQAADTLAARACEQGMNFRVLDPHTLCIALDETTDGLDPILEVFAAGPSKPDPAFEIPPSLARTSPFLTHPVFNRYHTEHEMLRYLHRLESRDLSLTTSMIPLGSCTMKLTASSQMLPLSWPEFARLHPFAPASQTAGYAALCASLEQWLAEITGFAGCSLQPNAGSQGEYAGLLAIRAYHTSRGEGHRHICLIPTSAHGTNPASATMAGLKVVPVRCRDNGDIDLKDLRTKAEGHRHELAALMVTYPSTHGVFEPGIRQICAIIHACGGQVYMDGANMNAQVGLTSPAIIGADVCHLNLHKTFCIPHGGGGPGVGPICVAAHLLPFLPARTLDHSPHLAEDGPPHISATPYGSALILVIPWMYLRTMGADGLTAATRLAILNANYIAHRLNPFFPVLYKGAHGLVAHECIIDLRGFKSVTAEDVAKRLMDYGFHAPTLSWPVAGTLMIEPTESESKAELDRFCDALIAIHGEITAIERGTIDAKNNPLKNAPHTAAAVCADRWDHPYSREQAAFPAPWLREHKFWPHVGRIDNVFGDRNLFCSCPPVDN